MARNLTSGMVTQVTADTLTPVLLFKFEFDSGALRLWTGAGEITYDSEVYTGSGRLLEMTTITETQSVKASGVNFRLSGVNGDLISLALTEDYNGRDANVWLGAIENGSLVTSPYLVFKGKMDVMEFDEGGEDSQITLSAENELISLQRARKRLYTPQDQAINYPNDKGFDFVVTLQDKELRWGR